MVKFVVNLVDLLGDSPLVDEHGIGQAGHRGRTCRASC